jgi:hypothetical protein
MGVAESEQKGSPLLVVAARHESDGMIQWVRIEVEIPLPFDFDKQGKKLLRDIQSAANLFFQEGE